MKLKNSVVSFVTVLVLALTVASGQVLAAGGGEGGSEATGLNPLLVVFTFVTLAYFIFVTIRES